MIFKNSFDKIFFFKIPTYLFILLPIFLISGPFLSDLAISFIAIIFLIYCFKNNDFSYFNNKYFYFFLTFCFYLILNSLLNNLNLNSIKISVFYFRFGVFVVAMIAYLKFNNQFLKIFFYSLLFCFVILIFDGFWQYFFDRNIFGWEKAHEYRVSSFFGDELILGSYLSRLFPILFGLGYFLFSKNKIKFSFLVLIFIFSEVLIFLSGERTSFFFINLSAFFIIFFSKNLKLLRLTTLLISLVLIFFISLIDQTAKKRIIDNTINQIFPKIENKLNDPDNVNDPGNANDPDNVNDPGNVKDKFFIFSKHHTHHYITAYRIFKDNIFFGVGVKNFKNFCNFENYRVSELSCSTHPHNTYLQLMSEIGLFGFGFFLILLIIFLNKMIKHIAMRFSKSHYFNDFQICILSGIIITLWPFVPAGNFFNNWLSIIYYLSLPIIFWSFDINNKKN